MKKSKFKIRLIQLSLAIISSIMLFILFLSLPPGAKIISRIISGRISRLLDMNLDIRDLETNVLNRLYLKGITLTIEADSTELLSIEELLINYQIFSLFGKNPHISTLALAGLNADMNLLKSDSLIQSRLEYFSSGQDLSESSLQITIDRLSLLNTTIQIEDNRIPLYFQIEDLDIEGAPVSTDTIDYQVHLKTVKGYYEKSELNLSQLHLAGTFLSKEMIGSAWLQVDRLQADSLDVNQLEASVRMNREIISMDTFQTQIYGGMITGSGQIAMDESQPGMVTLNIEGIQLPQLQNSINLKPTLVNGKLNGILHASGNGSLFRDWKALAQFYLTDIRTQKQQIPPYRIDFNYADQNMDFTFSDEASLVVGNMQLQPNGFSGTFSFSFPKIERVSSFLLNSPVYGTVLGKGKIKNVDNQLEIDLNLWANKLQFRQYRSDSLYAYVTYDHNDLQIQDFLIIHPSGWNQEQKTIFDRVQFALLLNGEFDPQNRTGFMRTSIHSYEKTSGSFDPDSSWADIFCQITGSENQIKIINVQGEVNNLSVIQNIFPDSPSLQGQLTVNTEYHLNDSKRRLVMRGKVDQPSLENQILADSLLLEIQAEDNRIDPLQLIIYQKDRQHQIESVIESDQNLFSGDVSHTLHTRGSILLDSLNLLWIKPWLPDSLETVGFIDTGIHWEGRFPDLHPVGQIVLNGDIYHPARQIRLDNLQLAITVKDTLAEVPACRFTLQSIPVSLKAQLFLLKNNSLALHADTDVYNQKALSIDGIIKKDSIQFVSTLDQFPVSLFEPLNPEIRHFSGMIDAYVNVSGTSRSPLIDGELTIRDMTFSPQWSEIPFSNGYLHFLFMGNRLNLDTLNFVQNQGYIGSSGFVQITGNRLSQLNLKTDLSKLKIMKRKQYDMQIQHAHIEMNNEGETYTLNGLVVLDKSVIQNVITPTDIIQKIQTRDRPPINRPGYFQKIKIDIRIQESENLWVDNNLVKVRLHPELRVMGNLNTIRLEGRVSIREGYLLYLDRKFKINRGILDFIDPNRINPEIDLIAVHQLSSHQSSDQKPYAITLSIQGPLDQALLELSSEPYLDEADILTLLTVGSTRQAMTDRGSATLIFMDLLKERAASLSNERLINYASRTINETLSFAEISIDGNIFRQDDESPTITASRNLFQRITITYSTRIGHINDQSIRLNYPLHDQLMLQGETDRYGRSGLDLIYRIGFK